MLRSTCDSAAKCTITSGFSSVHQIVHQLRVADIPVYEAVTLDRRNGEKIFEIPGVGELIEIDELRSASGAQHESDEGAPDESSASGNQKFHHLCCVSQSY